MIFHDLDVYPLDQNSSYFILTKNIVRASTTDSEKFWQPLDKPDLALSNHLDTILEDYSAAFDGDRMHPLLISSRVDAILRSIVTAAKSKHPGERSRMQWYPKEFVHFSIGETVTRFILDIFDTKEHYLRCLADGILRYDKKEDLTASLVVRKISDPVEEDDVKIPGALLMLLHSRGLIDNSEELGMYGIVTDSYKWHFLWVDRKFQYFQATFDWMKEDERQRIINHVRDIVDYTIPLVNPEPPFLRTARDTAGYLTQSMIWDEYNMDKVIPYDEDEECHVDC